MKECAPERIPQHCADAFADISERLGKLDEIASGMKELRKVVVGNGDISQSLAFRLKMIENKAASQSESGKTWKTRAWGLLQVAFGVALGFAFSFLK